MVSPGNQHCANRIGALTFSFASHFTRSAWFAQYAVSVTKRPIGRPSVCLSRRSTTAAAATCGFAAEVGRGQQISINSCRCRAICQRKALYVMQSLN